MDIAEFQQLIRERYYATDSARGAPGTFLWFAEEVGELAKAIGQHERGDSPAANQAELQDEFADVLAWLATLANVTGVDLDEAVRKKYVEGGGPKGTK